MCDSKRRGYFGINGSSHWKSHIDVDSHTFWTACSSVMQLNINVGLESAFLCLVHMYLHSFYKLGDILRNVINLIN